MKIIWNDEATAPEAPFFAAPENLKKLEELTEAWFKAGPDFESEDDDEE